MKILILLLVLTADVSAQDNWPGFLGAGSGPLANSRLPTRWSPDSLAWKTTTPGYGQSSPVIYGDHIYLTAVEGDEKETLHVVCCSLQTGKILWDKKQPSSYPEKNSVYISRAAPTPTVDEQGVYAYFESGDVVALNHDGKVRWSSSLTKQYGAPKNEFGLSGSPVQLEDRIVILVDDEGPSYIVALDKQDGKELWKTERTSRKSWSSPMLVPFEDSVQIVCSSEGSIDGYDPQTGKQLWTFDDVGGNSSTSPVPIGQGAFLVAASPGRGGENANLAKKSNGLFTVTKEGEKWNPQFAWKNPAPTPSWGSPIAHHGYAYWVNRSGVVFCLDIESGQVAYIERIKQSCWATPVGVGDHVYIFGKNGTTTVLASGGELRVVEENELWTEENPPINNLPNADETTEERQRGAAMFSQPTVYGVAVAGRRIILRTGSQVFCMGTPAIAHND